MAYQTSGEGWTLNIDAPDRNRTISEPGFELSGWLANTLAADAEFAVIGRRGKVAVRVFSRPDVEQVVLGQHIIGFAVLLSLEDIDENGNVCLEFLGQRHDLQFEVDNQVHSDLLQFKKEKAEVLWSILQCTVCGVGAFEEYDNKTICKACQTTFPVLNGMPDMRPGELVKELEKMGPTAVSSNGYDKYAWDIIEEFKDGLVLDNGAGLRNRYLRNVVNMEIADLPTTDVLGVGERLPFKDDCFDAVFSLAVLEHVKNPFACAKEIERVLKPGGKMYVAVPFLQPFHGYPNHYYNMTSEGLRNLFSPDLQVLEAGVPAAGKPIWTLSWILRSYVAGLPKEVAERFSNMTVGELLEAAEAQLGTDYVQQLSAQAEDELACVNFILAKKA